VVMFSKITFAFLLATCAIVSSEELTGDYTHQLLTSHDYKKLDSLIEDSGKLIPDAESRLAWFLASARECISYTNDINDNDYRLFEIFFNRIMEDNDTSAFEYQTGIVNYAINEPNYFRNCGVEKYRKIRLNNCGLLTQFVAKCNRDKIPGSDLNQGISTQPEIPKEFADRKVAIRYGIPPEYVKDTELRNLYEESIKKYHIKVETYNKQLLVADSLVHLVPLIETYLIHMYSWPPSDIPEITKLLDDAKYSEADKQRILTGIAQTTHIPSKGALDDKPKKPGDF
jgi:hypothetical protein